MKSKWMVFWTGVGLWCVAELLTLFSPDRTTAWIALSLSVILMPVFWIEHRRDKKRNRYLR